MASDASHFYENYRTGKPFPIVVDLEAMLNGFDRLRELAESDDHIIPGHDPLVGRIYSPVDGHDERIVALHGTPS